jgi:hypothetical protein
MQFLFNLLRIKGLEHYLLLLRRRYTHCTWYILCVLCQLRVAAPGMKWNQYTVMHGQQNIRVHYCLLLSPNMKHTQHIRKDKA